MYLLLFLQQKNEPVKPSVTTVSWFSILFMIINYFKWAFCVYSMYNDEIGQKNDTFNITGIFNLTHPRRLLSTLKKSSLESQLACECRCISSHRFSPSEKLLFGWSEAKARNMSVFQKAKSQPKLNIYIISVHFLKYLFSHNGKKLLRAIK